jgi:two-component system, LytTR family, sensor kinase
LLPSRRDAVGPTSVLRIGWRGLLLIVVFWTLFGGVMFASLFLSGLPRSGDVSGAGLFAFSMLGAYAWAALTLPIFHFTQRLNLTAHPTGWKAIRVAALVFLGLVFAGAISMAVSVSAQWLLSGPGLMTGRLAGPEGIGVMVRYRVPHDLLACLLVLTAGVARDYFFRYRSRLAEAEILRTQLAEAQLQVLRTQLNPHFLFNTLNAVAAMVQADPRGARRMIALLSDLLRQTLHDASEPEVPLEDELEMLRRYLEIMEIRFRGRLEARLAADDEVLQALVPQLILQPLVENSMKHGMGQGSEPGVLEVTARREGGDLVMAVRDSGRGASIAEGEPPRAHPDRQGGFGLKHTRERLRHLYGERASLTLTSPDAGGTVAEVRLPYHRDELPRYAEGVAEQEAVALPVPSR